MRRTAVVAAAAALTLTGGTAAHAASGSGSVTDTIVGTVVPGLLTIAGVGANVAVDGTPGDLTDTVGATVLTVSDLTGSENGWAVTATYGEPSAGIGIGAGNVFVSAGDVTGAITGSALALASETSLATPVTVASTGLGAGTGVTAMTATYKVRLPANAAVGDVFGAKVTYTVASVR